MVVDGSARRARALPQLTLSGEKGSIIDTDIFHPAAFQANGECQLADGITHSMSELQEMYLATLNEEEKDALFPYGITGGVTLELWDFIDALSEGRPVEIDAEEGLRSKAVSEAIYESGQSGQVVTGRRCADGRDRRVPTRCRSGVGDCRIRNGRVGARRFSFRLDDSRAALGLGPRTGCCRFAGGRRCARDGMDLATGGT